MLGRDVPSEWGALFQGAGLYPPPPLHTGSPFCRLSAWVDSPVVWASSLPQFYISSWVRVSPLFSALTTWTNPELINCLCWSHLSCSAAIFCFSGCDYDPSHIMQALVLCYKACPHQIHQVQLGASLLELPNSFLPSVLPLTSVPSGAKRRHPWAVSDV